MVYHHLLALFVTLPYRTPEWTSRLQAVQQRVWKPLRAICQTAEKCCNWSEDCTFVIYRLSFSQSLFSFSTCLSLRLILLDFALDFRPSFRIIDFLLSCTFCLLKSLLRLKILSYLSSIFPSQPPNLFILLRLLFLNFTLLCTFLSEFSTQLCELRGLFFLSQWFNLRRDSS